MLLSARGCVKPWHVFISTFASTPGGEGTVIRDSQKSEAGVQPAGSGEARRGTGGSAPLAVPAARAASKDRRRLKNNPWMCVQPHRIHEKKTLSGNQNEESEIGNCIH